MDQVDSPESVTLGTTDGLRLEAEFRDAAGAVRAIAVLCHPHPQFGGSMRSLVISELFAALPAGGVPCIRFNYRGVERSEGTYGEGVGERLDVLAALDAAREFAATDVPLVLVGWSFGADMVLATHDDRVAGWMGIAVPLRFVNEADRAAVSSDSRPKLLALAQHDEFRAPSDVVEAAAGWTNTRTEVVAGASHFFVGRTDRLVDLAKEFVASLSDVH